MPKGRPGLMLEHVIKNARAFGSQGATAREIATRANVDVSIVRNAINQHADRFRAVGIEEKHGPGVKQRRFAVVESNTEA